MLVIEPKLLRDAKAGNYKAHVYGRVRGFLQTSSQQVVTILGYNILILDISFYQDTADFEVMKANGISGVILRAGQNSWEDSKVKTFLRDAKAAGMPVGTYWFYDSRKSPQEQAELWKAIIGSYETPLGCWADYEENYGGRYGGWRNLYDFLEACKTEMPTRKFGIYTGYYYWLEHSPLTTGSLNYFAQYPLWLAWYTEDMSIVKIPKPWTKMLFWQKTSSGNGPKYGVGSKEVDINLFIGTKEEFELFSGSVVTIPDEPTEGEQMQIIKGTARTNVLLRGDPSTENSTVSFNGKDYLPANTQIEAKAPAVLGKWLNLTKIGNVEVGDTVLWASAGSNQQYIAWSEVTVPDDGEPPVEPEPTILPSTLFIATKEDMSDKTKYVKEV